MSPTRLLAPGFWLKQARLRARQSWAFVQSHCVSGLSGLCQGGLCFPEIRGWRAGRVPSRVAKYLQRELLEGLFRAHIRLRTRNRKEPRIGLDRCSLSTFTVTPACAQDMGIPGGEINDGDSISPGLPISKSCDISIIQYSISFISCRLAMSSNSANLAPCYPKSPSLARSGVILFLANPHPA